MLINIGPTRICVLPTTKYSHKDIKKSSKKQKWVIEITKKVSITKNVMLTWLF